MEQVIARIVLDPESVNEQFASKDRCEWFGRDWELLRDDGPVAEGRCRLEFVKLHGRGENVSWEEMQVRLKGFGSGAGQNHLKFLHRAFYTGIVCIPSKLERYDLLFPATVRQHRDGATLLPCYSHRSTFLYRQCKSPPHWVLDHMGVDLGFCRPRHLFVRIAR